MTLADKIKAVVLITGASSGLGRALAMVYAKKGHALMLTGRDSAELEKTVAMVNDMGGTVYYFVQDLAATDAVDNLIDFIKRQSLRIAILINNAGLGSHTEFSNCLDIDLSLLLTVNIQALVLLTHRIVPMMVVQQHGLIVNIASVYAYTSVPKQVVYAASKAFVKSFSLGLAMDLKPYGIAVSCICPGSTTQTKFRQRMGFDLAKKAFSSSADAVAELIYVSLQKPRLIYIPLWYNRIFVRLMHLLPHRWVPDLVGFIIYRLRKIKETHREHI